MKHDPNALLVVWQVLVEDDLRVSATFADFFEAMQYVRMYYRYAFATLDIGETVWDVHNAGPVRKVSPLTVYARAEQV